MDVVGVEEGDVDGGVEAENLGEFEHGVDGALKWQGEYEYVRCSRRRRFSWILHCCGRGFGFSKVVEIVGWGVCLSTTSYY